MFCDVDEGDVFVCVEVVFGLVFVEVEGLVVVVLYLVKYELDEEEFY